MSGLTDQPHCPGEEDDSDRYDEITPNRLRVDQHALEEEHREENSDHLEKLHFEIGDAGDLDPCRRTDPGVFLSRIRHDPQAVYPEGKHEQHEAEQELVEGGDDLDSGSKGGTPAEAASS